MTENRLKSRVQTTSPLMFESEDEDTLDGEDSANSNKENCIESVIELTKEEKLLKGFQTVLMGIPPPPAFTVPQLDCREILKLWRDNQRYRVVLSPKSVSDKQELPRQLEPNVKTVGWPEVLKVDHWDIYYNKGFVSEELEHLSQRYKDRYVGAETSTCINALFVKSPVRTASARKRARNRAWGHSPGRRLSHLARRRKAFSSANLCSVAGNNNPDKKMIMVEIKKIGNRNNKRNSAKKTKPTPKKKNTVQVSTHKRALFQSPDHEPTSNKVSQTPNSPIQRSKRNLFADSSSEKINENGKRGRPAVRRMSPRKRVNRSLSFQDHNQPNTLQIKPVPTPVVQPSPTVLSGAHKQKMLWAATNALREEGMGMNHELFRPCMTVLFKTCQKLWLMKVAKHGQEGSTSEKMLALAKQFSAYTIKEISADPTSEHMALVCSNIMKLAESCVKQLDPEEQPISKSSTSKLSFSKENSSVNMLKHVENINDISGNLEARNCEARKSEEMTNELKNDSTKILCDNTVELEINTLGTHSPAKKSVRLRDSPKSCRITRRTSSESMVKCVVVNNALLSGNSSQNGKFNPDNIKYSGNYYPDNNLSGNSVKLTSKVSIFRKDSPAKAKIQSSNTPEKSNQRRTSCDFRLKSPVVCLSPISTQINVVKSSPVRTNLPVTQSSLLTSPITRSKSCFLNNVKPITVHNSETTVPERVQNTTFVPDKIDQTSNGLSQNTSPSASVLHASKINTPAKSICQKDSNGCLRNAQTNFTLVDSSPAVVHCHRSGSEAVETLMGDFETNKENIRNQNINDCFVKVPEVGRSCLSERNLLLEDNPPQSEITPTTSINRTLQLYRLSNSGGNIVETDKVVPVMYEDPPKLVPHWDESEETSDSLESPPSLVPHWEQSSCSGTSTSLPESIMTHWQQLSSNSNANPSDKIMFDFEDTSYEINFHSTNDDSRASSTCAPFDFPNLIDESRSSSNNVFRRSSND